MQSNRTQIYLPSDLRQQIDKQRRQTGESLAQYLRQAAEQRLEKQGKEKANLRKLADEVIGSLKISQAEAKEWIREIREDRKNSDERLEKRWAEARKLKLRNH